MLLAASVLTLNLCTVGTSQAQVALGIKVAGNRANYQKLTKGDFGLETGIFLRLGQNFYFQPEVNYSFKNSTFKEDDNEISSSNAKLRQHFVSVPALLGYHFINTDNFKFHLTFGPRFDFRIADNIEGTDWKANSLQWGAQVGLGFDLWRLLHSFSQVVNSDKKGAIEEMLTVYKNILPPHEYAQIKKLADKASNSLNKRFYSLDDFFQESPKILFSKYVCIYERAVGGVAVGSRLPKRQYSSTAQTVQVFL